MRRGNTQLNIATKNALQLVGYDLSDVGPDRPLTPDGQELVAEFWNSGASVELIMDELRLSEARVSAELMFLELKGKIFGFVWSMFG